MSVIRRKIDMKFIIDPELKALIPPLSQEEFEQLEQNIREWGCLDPLKVWPVPDSDEIILLDGHNRFMICSMHNVSYDTESISLIDRAAAINWMIANQLGRRNLSAVQVSYLRGKQQHQEKQIITNLHGNNQYKEVEGQNDTQPPESTAAKLAKEHGVSERTIKRDADYAKAVDAIVAATVPEVQQQLLGFGSKLTKSATLKLAELAQEEPGVLMEVLEEIQQAPNKTVASAVVQRSTSKIKEIPMNKETARLIDFDNVGDGINWLLGKFTAAEMSEWIAQNLVIDDEEEFDDDEED
jgi:hypothetical protein